MTRTVPALAAVALLLAATAGRAPAAEPSPAKADQDTALYAVGLSLARDVRVFELKPAELEQVVKGLRDGVAGTPAFPLEGKGAAIEALAQQRRHARATREAPLEQAYLAKAAAVPGTERLPSGVLFQPLKAGSGAAPVATDHVKVGYTGRLRDGVEFDGSARRGGPQTLMLSAVVPCWREAILKMKVGGQARVVCPAATAFGDKGAGPVPPGATLDFEFELLEIAKGPQVQK
jgi:FKBP-type peptidyl-prolyl cis-trans isomerase